ncbi:MAG: cell division protein FtsB [Sneathiella sp.]
MSWGRIVFRKTVARFLHQQGNSRIRGEEITESRIEAALQRLEKAAETLSDKPAQGLLDMRGRSDQDAELESLRSENASLRKEISDLTERYQALKQRTDIVSGRLDKTIDDIGAILE